MVWPDWPMKLRTSSSHEEGCERDWSVRTMEFTGEGGKVTGIKLVRLDWVQDKEGNWKMKDVPGSVFVLKADLVLLAMGFVNPVYEGMLEELGVDLDDGRNVKADTEHFRTSISNVFTAGDMRRGQSLVVWAIQEGRECARSVDEFLSSVPG